MVLKFSFKIVLQVIAVKEQCLNFSNDSMLFFIKIRDSKKTRNGPRTTDHGRTDRPSYRDAWTHLKTSLSNLQFPRFIMPTRNRPSTQPLAVRVAQGKILPHPSRKLCLSSKCNNNSLNHSNWVSVAQLALDFSQQLYRPLGRLGDHMRHPE